MGKKSKLPPAASGTETARNKYIDGHCLADHLELAPSIFQLLGIDKYYEFFLEHGVNNLQGLTRPAYHAEVHSVQVALNCYEGGLYSHLNDSELRTLVVAALFHDAGHSQGTYSDRVNIDTALRILETAHSFIPEHQRLKPLECKVAAELIRFTEYPYKVKKVSSVLAKILRDADMMSIYTADPDTLTDLYLGLMDEVNRGCTSVARYDSDYGHTVSVASFCKLQMEFMSRQEWNTAWAKLKALRRNWPEAFRRLVKLLQLSEQTI